MASEHLHTKKLTIMNRHTILTLLAVASTFVMTSCVKDYSVTPSDDIASKSYACDRITEVSATTRGLTVYYHQAGSTSLSVEGPANMVEALKVDTDIAGRGTLELKNPYSFNLQDAEQTVKIRVTSPHISSFEAMNEARIIIPGALIGRSELTVQAYSNGVVKLSKVSAQMINIGAYTAGVVKVADATATSMDIGAYERGVVSFDKLTADNISVASYSGASVTAAGHTLESTTGDTSL